MSTMYDHTGAEWGEKLVAKYMLLEQKYHFCTKGNYKNCQMYGLMDHVGGSPFLLTITFAIFGISSLVATYYGLFFSILLIPSVFLLSYALFKNEELALICALIMSILPWHVYLSGTVATDHVSSFFVTLFFISLLISLESNSVKMYLLTLLIAVFANNVAIENLLVFPLFILSLLIFNKGIIKTLKRIKTLLLIPLILSIPIFVFLSNFILNPWIGKEGITFSFNYLLDDLKLLFENSGKVFSSVLVLFFFVGLLNWKKYNKNIQLLLLWIASYFTLYGFYFQAILPNYIIFIFPSFSIIAGIGIFESLKRLEHAITKKFSVHSRIYNKLMKVIIVIIITFLVYLPNNLIFPKKEEVWGDKTPFNLVAAAERIDDKSWIIVPTYEEFTVLGFATNKKIFIESEYQLDREMGENIYFFLSPHCYFLLPKDYCDVVKNRQDYQFIFIEGNVEVYKLINNRYISILEIFKRQIQK